MVLLLVIRKPFYLRHSELIYKLNVRLKTLLQEDLSEPEFYSYLVCKFRKTEFMEQFLKIVTRYEKLGYNMDILRQTAIKVVTPTMVDKCSSLFNCTKLGRSPD